MQFTTRGRSTMTDGEHHLPGQDARSAPMASQGGLTQRVMLGGVRETEEEDGIDLGSGTSSFRGLTALCRELGDATEVVGCLSAHGER